MARSSILITFTEVPEVNQAIVFQESSLNIDFFQTFKASRLASKQTKIPLYEITKIINDPNIVIKSNASWFQIISTQNVLYTFTSGSTGIPKCVMGKYESLTAFYPYMQKRFNLTSDLRYGMLSGVSHDPIQRDIFTPLYYGTTLYIPNQSIILNGKELSNWLNVNKINVICITPSLMRIIMSSCVTLTSLTHIFIVGEQLLTYDVTQFFDQLSDVTKIINIYGSTETQRAVLMYEVTKQTLYKLKEFATVPICSIEIDNGPVNIHLTEENEICIVSDYISNG
mgnify:CR=1 FL=1